MPSGGQFGGTDRFVRHPNVDSNPLPDHTVLLFQKQTGTAVPINTVGATIWEMCDGRNTLDEMVDRLAENYAAERSHIDRDARAFLGELVGLGLLDRRAPGA